MDSNRLAGLLLVMISGLELDRRDVIEGAVKPLVVEPVDPPERGELDVVDAAPRALLTDQLGLVEAVGGLGQGVEAPIDVKSVQAAC